MGELIKSEISKIQNERKKIGSLNLSDDRAFSYLLLKYVFNVEFSDQDDLVTDGPNDGGIDFLYYDEDESKIVLCQSKYTSALLFNDIISELNKMYSTLVNFRIGNTGQYNDRLKKALQNAIDRLPDDDSYNIEFNIFTTAPLDLSAAMKKINNSQHDFPSEAVKIYVEADIEKSIYNVLETLTTVHEAKLKIDRPNNILEYESGNNIGIMCNVLSTSIIKLYNNYSGHGLFDLNIRKYIRSNLVDSGINDTLNKDRENFWFLNNGIIIACQDFIIDGDTIKISDFSIVNGGQTTYLIGTYKGTNTKEFYIPCKIVSTKKDNLVMPFFTKIAEATNSQKPIYARDLKSNTPEMIRLSKLLSNENIYMEIKRGVKASKKYNHYIKNDELAQIVLSFTFQQPGTARNGKKKIFESSDLYAKIFKVNYFDDPLKKGFLLDLISLFTLYKNIEKEYKQNNKFQGSKLDVLKNGQHIIFAIMGILYRIVNNDLNEDILQNNSNELKTIPFTYSKFISNYKNDDFEKKLHKMIEDIISIVAQSYDIALKNNLTSSVSNYFKSDAKYIEDIIPSFASNLPLFIGEDLKLTMDIFKR